MSGTRILLMYVHEFSGHHVAAQALAKAFKRVNGRAETVLVDALRYSHPILERLIQKTYLRIVRKKPEVWGYLYDNPWVLRNTEALRRAIHKSDSAKLKSLLDDFKPDAIVCTQAFPGGIVSDYKATYSYRAPLFGVLTDYLPHSYWVLENVDQYFVPSQEAKAKLAENGILEDRISVVGIPIDPAYGARPEEKTGGLPLVLVMGGSQGLGPIEKIVSALDRLKEDFEMVVVTGKNKRLYEKLCRQRKTLKKKTAVFPYIENMAEYMRKATLLVSKPGGLTIAQALACQVPVVFIDPIPGQEAMNASFLLRHKAAVEAKSEKEVSLFVSRLLRNPAKVKLMKRNMSGLGYPNAAIQIAEDILKKAATA